MITLLQKIQTEIPLGKTGTHNNIDEPIIHQNDNAMAIDSNLNTKTPEFTPKKVPLQPVMLILSADQTFPQPSKPVSALKPKKKKLGQISIMHTLNNVVHKFQKGQVRHIMIYDIPATTPHDELLEHLKS
ncbi:hypothetical protein RclHR1_01810021 [Rhizophagus clarus]|nr:hypothetical protein RclHR1_01810021 [Rhizophagus clarus]